MSHRPTALSDFLEHLRKTATYEVSAAENLVELAEIERNVRIIFRILFRKLLIGSP